MVGVGGTDRRLDSTRGRECDSQEIESTGWSARMEDNKPDLSADLTTAFEKLFPNFPDEGQIARFFETLGRAVGTWQLVEGALYLVFERATDAVSARRTVSGVPFD